MFYSTRLLFLISYLSPTPSNWCKNILKTFITLPNVLSTTPNAFHDLIWTIIIWTLMPLMFLDLFFDTQVVLDVIFSALSAPWHLMLPKNENINLIQCPNILGIWCALWRSLLFVINNLSFLACFHVFLLFSCHLLSSNWFYSSMSLSLTKPLGHSQTKHSTNLDFYQGHLD
jgi:hypothetical protein